MLFYGKPALHHLSVPAGTRLNPNSSKPPITAHQPAQVRNTVDFCVVCLAISENCYMCMLELGVERVESIVPKRANCAYPPLPRPVSELLASNCRANQPLWRWQTSRQ